MNKCYVCEHEDSCLAFPIPYGCECFKLDLEEYNKQIRADERNKTIDECIALFKEYQPKLATHVSEFGDRLEQLKREEE